MDDWDKTHRFMIFPWNDLWPARGAKKIVAYFFNADRQLIFQYLKGSSGGFVNVGVPRPELWYKGIVSR